MALAVVLGIAEVSGSSVKLSAVASGGVGPYEYAYYYSTTSGFTPPGQGTELVGQEDDVAIASGLIPNTPYYFKVIVTDTGDSNATATSSQAAAVTNPGNLNQNQFRQESVSGKVDQHISPNTLSCEVSSQETGIVRCGYPVKVTSELGGVPKVVRATADSDRILGFVNYNFKQTSYEAGEAIQVSSTLNVIELPAGAAITRGADVCLDADPACVIPATGSSGKRIVGWAFDGASGPGELMRVQLYGPQGGLDS